MNWTKINETANLMVIVLQLVVLYFCFRKMKASKWVIILFINFLVMSILDVCIFYCYKFLDINLHWIDPFYLFINVFCIPLFVYYSLNNPHAKRYTLWVQILLGIFIIVRMFIRHNFTSYDQWTWLVLQIVLALLLLFNLYFIFTNTRKLLRKNPLLNINFGFFLMYFIPILSNFLQYHLFNTSPSYYQIALLVSNVTGFVALFIIVRGLRMLRVPNQNN